ncbi:GNAT family N-acetyltransferase [Microtetraspora malaysiensis]|uniref:GNAT family N-acetyltransferase n=1 Tax=Microtetraspora malaysiensis TaxID=161358 RepID=UPI003D90DAE5
MKDRGDHVGAVAVLVHPDFRRQKVGCRVVATLAFLARTRWRLLQYTTVAENVASQRLALRLGFRMYSRERVWWV